MSNISTFNLGYIKKNAALISLFHCKILLWLLLGNSHFDLKRFIHFDLRNGKHMDALFQLPSTLHPFLLLLALHPIGDLTKRQKRTERKTACNKSLGYQVKNNLFAWCVFSRATRILSIFGMALRTLLARFLSYLSGLLRFLSNSKVES